MDCAYGANGWRVAECSKSAAMLPQKEKKNSPIMQGSGVNTALSVQELVSPCGDLHYTCLRRWQLLCGGADAGLTSFYAACGCGTEYRRGALPGGLAFVPSGFVLVRVQVRGETCGDMLEAMARVSPPQPNEAMAHMSLPQSNGSNGKQQKFTRP
jgi:hypothetical protein